MLAPLTPPVAVWATSKATDTGCAIPTSEARDSVSLRGVVKAGCKVTISARLKRDGMHWTVTGANAIIALRCCRLRRGSRPGRPFSDRLLIGFRSGSLRSRRIGKNTDRTLSLPGTRTPSRGEGPASGIQGGWPGDSYMVSRMCAVPPHRECAKNSLSDLHGGLPEDCPFPDFYPWSLSSIFSLVRFARRENEWKGAPARSKRSAEGVGLHVRAKGFGRQPDGSKREGILFFIGTPSIGKEAPAVFPGSGEEG